MCPGNGTSQCAQGMGLANVPWEWDYPMCPGNGTNVPMGLSLGMGLANVPWEWDYPMGLANVPLNGTIQCALGMGLSNVPWEWD